MLSTSKNSTDAVVICFTIDDAFVFIRIQLSYHSADTINLHFNRNKAILFDFLSTF